MCFGCSECQQMFIVTFCISDFADRLFEPLKYESQADKRRQQMQVFDIADMEEVFQCIFSYYLQWSVKFHSHGIYK